MSSAPNRAVGGCAALAAALLLAGCKSIELPSVPSVKPYRMVIQQGNYISQEMVAQLKPGMTKEQVRYVLGTPLVSDIFHADRWDYVFFRDAPGNKREQRNLSVIFEKDRLARVIGDLMPAEGSAPPQAGGFEQQFKASAKPAAEPAKPASAEPAKPGTEAPAASAAKPGPEAAPTAPTGQNWRAASDEPEKKPEAVPAAEDAKQADAKAADEKKGDVKKAEEPGEERGWWGRMLEKIGL